MISHFRSAFLKIHIAFVYSATSATPMLWYTDSYKRQRISQAHYF